MNLITGGTGLLGGHLLLHLLKNDEKVRVLLRSSSSPQKVIRVWKHYIPDVEHLIEKVEWYYGDISDKSSVWDAFDGIKRVYHCAASVSFQKSKRKEMLAANVTGTQNIVDLCMLHGVEKLVHVSSIAAIQQNDTDSESDENNGVPVHADIYYSKNKIDAELEVWRGIAEGLNAVIINPAVILGPGSWEDGSSLIIDVVYKGLNYYTEGSTGFVDARDVADVMVLLMKSKISGERFIVNAANVRVKDMLDKVALALHKNPPAKFLSPFLAGLACQAERWRSLIAGGEPRLTSEKIRISRDKTSYSSQKLISQTGFTFRNIDETIAWVTACYLNDRQAKD